MSKWEAPGKLNLALLVHPPRRDGYHPIESLVQTVDWCDVIDFEDLDGPEDLVEVDHPEIQPEDDLVAQALAAVRARAALPPQRAHIEKHLPVAAGMGGGSSDAAATVMAAGLRVGLDRAVIEEVAGGLGADVPLFLTGGTVHVGGIGEKITPIRPLDGLALAVVVPQFGLSTADVYTAWDRLGGPEGETIPGASLPPALRGGMPSRNDLLPAAAEVEPMLAEFMAEVRAVWGQPVALTGAGSACFGYFATVVEADAAAAAVSHMCSVARGVALRPHGVAPLPQRNERDER